MLGCCGLYAMQASQERTIWKAEAAPGYEYSLLSWWNSPYGELHGDLDFHYSSREFENFSALVWTCSWTTVKRTTKCTVRFTKTVVPKLFRAIPLLEVPQTAHFPRGQWIPVERRDALKGKNNFWIFLKKCFCRSNKSHLTLHYPVGNLGTREWLRPASRGFVVRNRRRLLEATVGISSAHYDVLY